MTNSTGCPFVCEHAWYHQKRTNCNTVQAEHLFVCSVVSVSVCVYVGGWVSEWVSEWIQYNSGSPYSVSVSLLWVCVRICVFIGKTPPVQFAAGAAHHMCQWSICTCWWKENTTSASCKGQDQHQLFVCAHISKCASAPKKNTTSASCTVSRLPWAQV